MFLNDRRRLCVGIGTALIGSMGLLGCTVTTTTSGPADGTVLIDWTIEGSTDPNLCTLNNAANIEIDITSSGGVAYGPSFEACDAFAINISLPPGSYTAQATLLDSSSADRTTTININSFNIISHTELDIPIDYPASSFK